MGLAAAGFLVVFALGLGVLASIPYYRVLTKAGYPGWLFLLIFVPGVNLIAPFVFAYSEWPIERRLRDAEARLSAKPEEIFLRPS